MTVDCGMERLAFTPPASIGQRRSELETEVRGEVLNVYRDVVPSGGGLECLAVGQLFSALTQNQIVAALITAAVLLGFWFVGHLQSFQTSYALRSLCGYLSFALHFADFIQGLVRTEAVMFYLVVGAMALTLNASYLQWRR